MVHDRFLSLILNFWWVNILCYVNVVAYKVCKSGHFLWYISTPYLSICYIPISNSVLPVPFCFFSFCNIVYSRNSMYNLYSLLKNRPWIPDPSFLGVEILYSCLVTPTRAKEPYPLAPVVLQPVCSKGKQFWLRVAKETWWLLRVINIYMCIYQ